MSSFDRQLVNVLFLFEAFYIIYKRIVYPLGCTLTFTRIHVHAVISRTVMGIGYGNGFQTRCFQISSKFDVPIAWTRSLGCSRSSPTPN